MGVKTTTRHKCLNRRWLLMMSCFLCLTSARALSSSTVIDTHGADSSCFQRRFNHKPRGGKLRTAPDPCATTHNTGNMRVDDKRVIYKETFTWADGLVNRQRLSNNIERNSSVRKILLLLFPTEFKPINARDAAGLGQWEQQVRGRGLISRPLHVNKVDGAVGESQ